MAARMWPLLAHGTSGKVKPLDGLGLGCMGRKSIEIDGVKYTPRANVSREGTRWRVQICRRSEGERSILRKSFRDAEHEGIAGALEAAHAWMDAQSVRPPYAGIDRTTSAGRKITLVRRLKSSRPGGKKLPYFWLEITPSKSKWRKGWMRIYLGSMATIDQAKIDDTILTLRARWRAYRDHEKTHGRDAALSADFEAIGPGQQYAHSDEAETNLLLADLIAWNGRGSRISYSPASTVDPERVDPFQPESAEDGYGSTRKGELSYPRGEPRIFSLGRPASVLHQ